MRAVVVVDAVVRVERLERDALVEVLADGAVGLLERLLHDQDRRPDVDPEAVLLQHVRTPARPRLLFDDGDVQAHLAQPQRCGQPTHARADNDNRLHD